MDSRSQIIIYQLVPMAQFFRTTQRLQESGRNIVGTEIPGTLALL
jgi:hypothetical protein